MIQGVLELLAGIVAKCGRIIEVPMRANIDGHPGRKGVDERFRLISGL